MRTRALPVVAAGVAAYVLFTQGLPSFHSAGGHQRDPRDISFDVQWPGRNTVAIVWYVTQAGSNPMEGSPIATGGHWHHDVTVHDGPGIYEVYLGAVPAPVLVHTHQGDFKKSTVTTCTVTSVSGGVEKNVAPAVITKGCKVHTRVIVPPE